MTNNNIKTLPLKIDLESKRVLKKLISANKTLARLCAISEMTYSKDIISNLLMRLEAKESLAIDDIDISWDDIFIYNISKENNNKFIDSDNYTKALLDNFKLSKDKSFVFINQLDNIEKVLNNNKKNIFACACETDDYLDNLMFFINQSDISNLDPLLKVALIHYQFYSINAYNVKNNQIARILILLYLAKENLLSQPILYISRFFRHNKIHYFRLLEEAKDEDKLEIWILFVLDAIEKISLQAIDKIKNINELIVQNKNKLELLFSDINTDILNEHIFLYPYTNTKNLAECLSISEAKAEEYLARLEMEGVLYKEKIEEKILYINRELCKILE